MHADSPRRSNASSMYLSMGLVGAILTGCGGSGESKTAVRGNISYQGAPITSGLINFQPAGGQTIGGAIDADGSYAYEMPPGEYKVRIDAPGDVKPWKEGEPEPKPVPRQMPDKYADYGTSGLTATIGGESPQQLDFKLP